MTKQERVKKDLLKGKKVSGLSAWRKYGLYRLSGVIKKLRNAGMKRIITELRTYRGSTYGVYYLPKKRN